MKTVKIKLSTIADVRDFVNAMVTYGGDVDLASGRYVVDGKSIMGIFSLDLLNPINMTIHGEAGAEELLAKINKFIVE
ncbi:MAG: HPr family phosphocarrier protein [Clostridia bacterium]|nr:HPr family phosphocarrier protein [Clostridia bacterium]